MKNPVRFSNRKNQTIFIYRKYDNSYFQLAKLIPRETTVLNIPYNSYIIIKKGHSIKNIIVPTETILETQLNLNSNFFFL